jgi:pyruvate, water dikinase
MDFYPKVESGSPGLDRAVDSIRLGDNVVWQIDDVSGYADFALAFARKAVADGRVVAYMRFASHPEIVPAAEAGVRRFELDASSGFEPFAERIHRIVDELGRRAFYVFDCLSVLADAWATDLMIGNFFVATCPFLFELETVAYFCILRNRHSSETVARIKDTTQLFLDLYGRGEGAYLHPLKVWKRYSPTMFLPHRASGGSGAAGLEFTPLVSSSDAAAFFAGMGAGALGGQAAKLDAWDIRFLKAERLCLPGADPAEREAMKDELCARLTCRDEGIVALAKKRFSLEDLVAVKRRMVGTGYIGGKAAGMLLARTVIEGSGIPLEAHDSFYVGSDVFYTYLVQNGLWKLRMRQKTKAGYLSLAGELREGLSRGSFPEGIREQFYRILEYFGQSPIIVRSSSLLEDGFGNAFAGKYESIFCANQGDPESRYRAFEDAVRTVYASMMGEAALSYRARMGLSNADEQMALLVQRVSGSLHGRFFFPFLAGVADSRNAYAWKPGLDQKAGMLRIVVGLGTRAVDRTGDDWPRLVALGDPDSQPYANREEEIKYSQKAVDVLDLGSNAELTIPLEEALASMGNGLAEAVSARDYRAESAIAETGRGQREIRYADLKNVLNSSDVCASMRSILGKLEAAYRYPIDAEFTINPVGGGFAINILQCRPLAVRAHAISKRKKPAEIRGERLLDLPGGSMGGGFERELSRIVYVSPAAYRALPPAGKASLVGEIGKLNASLAEGGGGYALFLTPGRCGSRMADLGLSVNFADICNFGAIGELSDPQAGFAPELSYGSHFFRDLVETGIFYMAIFAEREGVVFNRELFLARPSRLEDLVPGSRFGEVVHVSDWAPGELLIRSDLAEDRTVIALRA